MRRGPRYLRKQSSDDAASTSNVDNEYPQYPEAKYIARPNTDLNVTGLREKKLMAMIIWLVVLYLFALVLLIINILIIWVLQMDHHGMKSLKIYNYENSQTQEVEPIVHFTAQKSHFDNVVVGTGRLFGPKRKVFTLKGSRIILGRPVDNKTKLLLQEGLCRIENADQFLVLSSANSKTLFNAQHPLVSIDQRIKQLSTANIVTNKVRAPMNENLQASAENIIVRGNEGIQMEAKSVNVTAKTAILLNTTTDGSLYLSAQHIYLGNQWRTLLMSSSPALSASVEAYRLCICKSSPLRAKLFLVNGNRPCIAPQSVCK